MLFKKKEKGLEDDLVLEKDPKSSLSEAIRSVRTNLQFSSVNKKIKIILLTSPEPGDGKSFISANLACAYAQDNKKVLIIDCDLRRGRQNRIFGVKKDTMRGYSNLILNYKANLKIEEYIVKTRTKNVSLIPNGPTPPNPVELLSSQKNEKLLEDLSQMFDVIILDCPPVLGMADTLVMTKYSDANIITVSEKKSKMEGLKLAKKNMEKVEANITGVIINKANVKKSSYYGYGYY